MRAKFFLLDAQPLSQMNPKKKIFETIQPGMELCFLPWVSKYKRSIFVRVHHTGDEGGGMD